MRLPDGRDVTVRTAAREVVLEVVRAGTGVCRLPLEPWIAEDLADALRQAVADLRDSCADCPWPLGPCPPPAWPGATVVGAGGARVVWRDAEGHQHDHACRTFEAVGAAHVRALRTGPTDG